MDHDFFVFSYDAIHKLTLFQTYQYFETLAQGEISPNPLIVLNWYLAMEIISRASMS